MSIAEQISFLLELRTQLQSPGTALHTTTGKLAEILSCSQQTISRRLRQAQEQNLIVRTVTPQGMQIKLTPQAVGLLLATQKSIETFFSTDKTLCVSANILPGLGEGQYYMSQEGYKSQFKQILGYIPFPGTLNAHVDPQQIEMFLSSKQKIDIKGFQTPLPSPLDVNLRHGRTPA